MTPLGETEENFKEKDMGVATKEKSLQVLTKELDEVFSEFIRLRDSENGRVRCFICGIPVPWRSSQCGHFIDRDQMSTRFNELNCHAICEHCNCYDTNHHYNYERSISGKLGPNVVRALEYMSKSLAKFMRSDLLEMIEHYKSEVSKLKKLKGINEATEKVYH